jgi:hypothetical protein
MLVTPFFICTAPIVYKSCNIPLPILHLSVLFMFVNLLVNREDGAGQRNSFIRIPFNHQLVKGDKNDQGKFFSSVAQPEKNGGIGFGFHCIITIIKQPEKKSCLSFW